MAPLSLGPPGLKDRFIAHLTGTPPGGPPLVPRLGTPELLAMQGQAADLCARAQTPRFSPALRSEVQGKRSPVMAELLLLCGRGLKARDGFARKIGVDEAACQEAAVKDGALCRLCKAAGDVHDCAGEAAAQVAAAAQASGERVLAAAAAFLEDPAQDRAARIAVEDGFAEAFRLHQEAAARAGRREQQKERRQRPLRQALAKAQSGAEEVRLIDRFLDRSSAGRPPRDE